MKFYETIETLLKSNADYIDQDSNLLKAKIIDEVHNNSIVLLKMLLSQDEIKQAYFEDIEGINIFLKDKFLMMISDKNFLLDSYTSYKNKIGLVDDKSLIKSNSNVVLNFPFKDCYLEGGQSKENDKSRELFFNEVLAKDELDRLLDPKGFVNCKRVDKNGESPLTEFNIDTDDKRILKDNLLIKGNNLLALHSLKKRFAGKVKLIYIDPPYNTGKDSFNYNDTFNHSSWLVFMKNRLEIARDLLREDGVIFVQCDDNEQAYLKVLMDEVFGRSSHTLMWRKTGDGRDGKMKNTNVFRKDHEYIHVGFKGGEYLNKSYEKPNWINSYPNPDNDSRGNYKAGSISRKEDSSNPNSGKYYTVISPSGKEFTRQFDISKEEFEKLDRDNRIYWGQNLDNVPSVKIFENEKRTVTTSSILLNKSTFTEAKDEFELLFNKDCDGFTPKPELLIEFLIQIATNENDIVLDFFAGSGTTAAVSHKMKRQWITIEQMDYIDTVTKERLKKVLEGEQGGISKSVDWQGGGDFVSMELAPFNEIYKQQILKCNTTDEFMSIYDEMREKAFLDYRYDLVKELKGDKEFTDLDFSEQQRILIDILDKNQMYIPYTEIEDTTYNLDQNDINRSHDFYKNVYL